MSSKILSKIINPVFLGLFILLACTPPTYGDEQQSFSFQGVILSFDKGDGFIIVNERKILLTRDTEFVNHQDQRIPLAEWTSGKWVYVTGHSSSKGTVADRLFLLPGRVKTNEKGNYPFMLKEEDNEDENRNGR